MTTPPQTDHPHKGWIAIFALIAVLVAVSFIPPQTIGGVKFRRANILSDLLSFNDTADASQSVSLFDEAEFRVDMDEVAERIVADTAAPRVQVSFDWVVAAHKQPNDPLVPDTTQLRSTTVAIEDFAPEANGSIAAFCDTLLAAQRPVRIAVLGDSFIEGDILTADLREQLQVAYGGGGAGFAPIASPLTAFRRTIKTQANGWTAYGIMQRKAAPISMRENFYVSGWVCSPVDGASTRWTATDYRRHLDSCTTARIFFISPSNSQISLTLNDTLSHEVSVRGDAAVRQIVVTAPHIHSLEFKVRSGQQGFIGYGAVFEAQGVVVDNYSVRSNNGQAMFWTNPSVNAQINALMGYDLVILQYGLNIMQTGVRNYTSYADQIEKMIAYVRQCFPGAAVMVMGVSDRSVKGEADFQPMDALPSMLAYQRQAAQNAGAAFWNTCEAMRTLGGMERFVADGWAGKDFTHINYAGGRRIASLLFAAIHTDVCQRYTIRQLATQRDQTQPAVLDTLQLKKIEERLLPGIISEPIHNTPLQ
ncbi:MAG: hypothetical protein RR199_02300 [Alistipes sp.]